MHAAEDASDLLVAIRHVAAALHAFPAQFHEQALLWIGQLGFAGRHAKEARIKAFHIVDDAPRVDVAGIFPLHAYRRIQFIG